MAGRLGGSGPRGGWRAALALAGLLLNGDEGFLAPGSSVKAFEAAETRGGRNEAVLRAAATAWRARENKVRSFVFQWRETEFVAKGTDRYRTRDGSVVDFPPNDVVHEARCLLKVAAGKMRYERRGPSLVCYLGGYADRLLIDVNDEETISTFHGGGDSSTGRFYPVGFIRNATPRVSQARNMHLAAMLLCYDPFLSHPGDDYDLSKYTVSTPSVRLGDRECLIASGPEGSDVFNNVLWLDLSQQYVPLRWQSVVNGVLRIQMDVAYTTDKFGIPIPSKWDFVAYGHPKDGAQLGRVHTRVEAEVVDYQVNVEIPACEFRIEKFPVGTLVADERRNEYYILGEGGRRLVIRDADWENFDYYEFLSSKQPGLAQWRLGATAIGLFLFLVMVALIRWRLQRARRAWSS